jgi:hypothetical protein
VKELREENYLTDNIIPSWKKSDQESELMSQPERPSEVKSTSTSRPVAQPTTIHKRGRKKKPTAAMTPTIIPFIDDIEMSDDIPPPTATSRNKGKGRAQSVLPPAPLKSQNESGAGKAGSKRPLQESPPQVRSVLKRHRGEARMNKAELGVDLGRLSVREGSPIDIKLIPALKNQVSFTSHH